MRTHPDCYFKADRRVHQPAGIYWASSGQSLHTDRFKKVLVAFGPHYATLVILLNMQPNLPYEKLKERGGEQLL